jgi:hypothetical protein
MSWAPNANLCAKLWAYGACGPTRSSPEARNGASHGLARIGVRRRRGPSADDRIYGMEAPAMKGLRWVGSRSCCLWTSNPQ